ncbi:hypothetical protein BKA63DRAFT_568989 [Paraphoma chrysanthemicola]|nr:hypothetical protein BKA63DRAFT_568989 [Paraphoma chrysanthemicola]
MPTIRSINLALHSQFDAVTLPEYDAVQLEPCVKPDDDASSTCTVLVPILAGSTFWISYSISPPVPEGHHFLFKLYINSAHIVSWSVGKEESWRGKTMFGLYERAEDEDGKRKIEKRALCFMPPDEARGAMDELLDGKMGMEIRVHRAHGRKRVERSLEEYGRTEHAQNERGIRLVNAGCASAELPKRFYKFALIDAVDQPFATFRYLYRTWDQLRHLGLLHGDDQYGDGEENDLSVIEPDVEGDTGRKAAGEAWDPDRDTDDVVDGRGDGAVDLGAYVGSGAPGADAVPRTVRPLPAPPGQSDSWSRTAYHAHPAYPLEEWTERTRSPGKSARDGITPSPLGKREGAGGRRALSLISVWSSAWKRRGTSSASSGSLS